MLGVKPDRTSVVHLAVTPDKQDIGYVGARGGYKNFAAVIRAFAVSEFLRNNLSLVCFGAAISRRKKDRK
jgi:hypothetical protein